jgi:hypothetical protein
MAAGKCGALVANGRQCRRNAKTRNGLCGKCHALTERGTQCKCIAKGLGEYCLNWPTHRPRSHEVKRTTAANRLPAAEDSASTRRSGTNAARKDLPQRVRVEAAKICADAMSTRNLDETIREKLVDVVGEKTVDMLTRHWDGTQCNELAKVARKLLGVRSYFQKLLSSLITRIMLLFGYGDPVSIFTGELVKAVPVPWFAKVTAAARIIQLTGIWLCFINDRKLTACECMTDLVKFESIEVLGRLLTAGLGDWRQIVDKVPLETGQLRPVR